MHVKRFALLSLVFASLATAGPVLAQGEVQFQGSALGCFGAGCTPAGSATGGSYFAEWDLVNFYGSTFDAWTTGGSLDIGTSSFNFGYFTWDYDLFNVGLMSSPFTLALNFTNPTGITPGTEYGGGMDGYVFGINLFGQFIGEQDMELAWVPNQRTHTFTGPGSGQFTLTLDDISLNESGRTYITGQITNATVTPEPVSMALLGTGLAGLGLARLRRRRKGEEVA